MKLVQALRHVRQRQQEFDEPVKAGYSPALGVFSPMTRPLNGNKSRRWKEPATTRLLVHVRQSSIEMKKEDE